MQPPAYTETERPDDDDDDAAPSPRRLYPTTGGAGAGAANSQPSAHDTAGVTTVAYPTSLSTATGAIHHDDYYCAEHRPIQPDYPTTIPQPLMTTTTLAAAHHHITPPAHAYGAAPVSAYGGDAKPMMTTPMMTTPPPPTGAASSVTVGYPPDNVMYIEQPAQYHVYQPEPSCPTGMILFLLGFLFP